jgi:hypothetical protein
MHPFDVSKSLKSLYILWLPLEFKMYYGAPLGVPITMKIVKRIRNEEDYMILK